MYLKPAVVIYIYPYENPILCKIKPIVSSHYVYFSTVIPSNNRELKAKCLAYLEYKVVEMVTFNVNSFDIKIGIQFKKLCLFKYKFKNL